MKIRQILLWGGLFVIAGGAIALGGVIYRHRTITYTPPEIEVAEITRSQLDDLIIPVDYGRLINQSLAGDARSLRRLVRLSSHTSGGGAYGLGAVLAEIAIHVGDRDYAAAIQPLSSQDLGWLHLLLQAGFEYGLPDYDPGAFATELPRTYALTSPAAGAD
jgi:hypothetical protein